MCFCTTYGTGASSTFLGIQVAEAVQAIGKLIPGSKSLARQWFLAASTNKAFLMPGLIPIGDASCSNGLK